jgi:type I restriction enzyme S subunit
LILHSPTEIARASWLSSIPNSWDILRFKDLFTFTGNPKPNEDLPILSLTRNGIVERDISGNEGQLAADYSDYPVIDAGTFVLNPMDLIAGWVAISNFTGRVSGAYFSFNLRENPEVSKFSSRYFEFVLQSYFTQRILNPFGVGLGRSEYGGGRWTLNRQTLGTIPFPVPPIDEQFRIVEYIDKEIAQIDNLLTNNSSLLNLLKQRRKVVIDSAIQGRSITNPPSHQKNSGWLCELPPSWSSGSLKWYAKFQTGATPDGAEYTDAEGFPWLRPDDLNPLGKVSQANRFIDVTGDKTLPTATAGSILMCCIGATLGKVGIINEVATFNQQITSITPNQLNPKFLFYVLSAAYEELQSISVGNTLNILNNSRLGSLKIPLPSPGVQRSIVEYLDKATEQIDALMDSVESQQLLLVEKRSTLVSEAVLRFKAIEEA